MTVGRGLRQSYDLSRVGRAVIDAMERFNGSLRDECLNVETFHNRDHARALVRLYGRHYNERRPHSALAYLTPAEFAGKWKPEQAGTVPGEVSVG